MRKAAAYVRMSTEHQVYSIENQLSAIESYCDLNELDLVQVYTDAGRSGLTFVKRPGIRSLISDVQAGDAGFEILVVLDVSRWGRFQNVDEGAYYEHILHRGGVRMVYCAEPFDNDDSPAMTIIKSVKRAMAAEYSRELSQKVSAGLRRVVRKGFRGGGQAGYGYRRAIVDESGQVVQVVERGEWKSLQGRTVLRLGPPEEVRAVQRIFRLYTTKSLGPRRIANQLELEGWPRPYPKGWSERLVARILANEKYAGTTIYGRSTQHLASGRKRANPADWIRVEDAHPAIVSKRTFQAAAARRNRPLIYSTKRDIIRGLKRIFAKHGTVTRGLIRDCEDLPSTNTVRTRFGTLERALLAAALPLQSDVEKRNLSQAARRRSP